MIKRHLWLTAIFFVGFGVFLVACTDPKRSPEGGPVAKATAEFSDGEQLFNNNCAGCHGVGAEGTDRGPTFLSKIYEPGHHGDSAFRLAVKQGVRAHHWNFGNMPKIRGVSPDEVSQIISYVRWIQRENGIS